MIELSELERERIRRAADAYDAAAEQVHRFLDARQMRMDELTQEELDGLSAGELAELRALVRRARDSANRLAEAMECAS